MDWSLFKPGHYPVLIELKAEEGKLAPEQVAWGVILKQSKGIRYLVLRPSNRCELEKILMETKCP